MRRLHAETAAMNRFSRLPIAIAAVGLVLTALAFGLARHAERTASVHRFEFASSETIDDLVNVVLDDIEAVQSLGEHLNVTGMVAREEFRTLAAPVLARHPTIQALQWLPRVRRGERERFERRLRITEGRAPHLKASESREEHFPVFYVEPGKGNEAMLGFDTASEPIRRVAMLLAAGHATAVATARVADSNDDYAVQIFTPIYRKGLALDSEDLRGDGLTGFIAGTFRAADVVAQVMEAPGRAHLDIHLFDLSARETAQRLYPKDSSLTLGDLRAGLHFEIATTVGGRRWLLLSTPAANYAEEGWPIPILALLGGLCLTALGWAYAQGSASRGRARREAEDLLRSSEQKLRAMFVLSPLGLALNSMDGRFIEANPAFLNIVGYSLDRLVRLSFRDLTPARYAEDDARQLELLRTTGRYGPYEKEYVADGGRRVPVRLSGMLVTGGDGVASIWSIVEDITEHLETQRALIGKTEELARSNTDLEQFAYVASHDLREPLRMVGTYVALIGRRYGHLLDDEGHEFIGFAKEGAERMDRLVLDLLEYSRIGRKARPMAPVPLAEAVEMATVHLRAQIEEAGASVEVDKLPTVIGDRVELARLMQNLIGNAVKYRHENRPPVIRVAAERRGDDWQISVADNGIGIGREYFQRIFLIFQRLHSRDKYDGTGIGLAVCKKIVEHHGGHIWAESDSEDGSTFIFTLPAGAW